MFSASFKESGFKNLKLLYATFENMNFTIWALRENLFNYAIHSILPLKFFFYILLEIRKI